MAQKINIEEAAALQQDSKVIFEELRGIFTYYRSFVNNAGENNEAKEVVNQQGKKLEDVFNQSVLTSFSEVFTGLKQYVENVEEWERYLKGIEGLNTSKIADTVVKSKVKPML